jgi:hypothetical protein
MTALFAGVSRSSSSKELAGACIGTVKRKRATPRSAGHSRQRLEGGERAMMLDDGEAQREAHENTQITDDQRAAEDGLGPPRTPSVSKIR